MRLFSTLLLLISYTICPMSQPITTWTNREFHDLLEKDHLEFIQKENDLKLQHYLDKKPPCIPLSRRECLTAAFWLATFVPPIIASHATIQTKLASLPIGYYLIGAGLTGTLLGYEIKKLTKVLKYSIYNNIDIEQEISESCI